MLTQICRRFSSHQFVIGSVKVLKATLLPNASELVTQEGKNANKNNQPEVVTRDSGTKFTASSPIPLPSAIFASTDKLVKFFSNINDTQVFFVSKSMLPHLSAFLSLPNPFHNNRNLPASLSPTTDPLALASGNADEQVLPNFAPEAALAVINSDIALANAKPTTLREISRAQSTQFHTALSSVPLAAKVEHASLSELDEKLHVIVAMKASEEAEEALTLFLSEHGRDHDFHISSNHHRHGGTALHTAASMGRTELMLKLLKHGADVNARANNLSTPLHWAAGMGQLNAVNVLIKEGADISARTSTWHSSVFGKSSGQTAAHWAAESGYLEVLEVLHAHSASVMGMEDERAATPLVVADKEMRGECSQFLQKVSEEEYFAVKFSVQYQDQIFLGRQPSSPT